MEGNRGLPSLNVDLRRLAQRIGQRDYECAVVGNSYGLGGRGGRFSRTDEGSIVVAISNLEGWLTGVFIGARRSNSIDLAGGIYGHGLKFARHRGVEFVLIVARAHRLGIKIEGSLTRRQRRIPVARVRTRIRNRRNGQTERARTCLDSSKSRFVGDRHTELVLLCRAIILRTRGGVIDAFDCCRRVVDQIASCFLVRERSLDGVKVGPSLIKRACIDELVALRRQSKHEVGTLIGLFDVGVHDLEHELFVVDGQLDDVAFLRAERGHCVGAEDNAMVIPALLHVVTRGIAGMERILQLLIEFSNRESNGASLCSCIHLDVDSSFRGSILIGCSSSCLFLCAYIYLSIACVLQDGVKRHLAIFDDKYAHAIFLLITCKNILVVIVRSAVRLVERHFVAPILGNETLESVLDRSSHSVCSSLLSHCAVNCVYSCSHWFCGFLSEVVQATFLLARNLSDRVINSRPVDVGRSRVFNEVDNDVAQEFLLIRYGESPLPVRFAVGLAHVAVLLDAPFALAVLAVGNQRVAFRRVNGDGVGLAYLQVVEHVVRAFGNRYDHFLAR